MAATGALRSRKLQRLLNLRWWEASPGQTLQVRSIDPFEVMPGPDAGAKIAESVATHDAEGDGSTDDGAAIQAAIDAAAGLPVWVPDGTYVITDTLTLPDLTHLWLAPGATIDATGLAANTPAVEAAGSFVDAVALTSDVAVGDTALSVASGDESAYTAGDVVRLRSEEQPDANQPKEGELHIVAATSDGEVTIEDGAFIAYATSDSATIERLDGVTATVEGGRWLGANADGAEWGSFTACDGLRIINTEIVDFSERAIGMSSCARSNIHFNRIDGCDQSGFGYGIVPGDATQWLTITDNHFSRCRHGVAGGGSSSNYGRARLVRVGGNTIYGGRGVNGHSLCQWWSIHDNFITSGGDPGDGDQINWNGSDVSIQDNTLVGSDRHGILVNPLTLPVSSLVVNGNVVQRPNNGGIIILASDTAIDGVMVEGNTVVDNGTQAIYLHVTGAPSVSDFVIAGNIIRGSGDNALYLRAQNGPLTWGVVANNRVTVDASVNAIRLLAQNSNDLTRVAINGNTVNGGDVGIAGFSQSDCFVDGNIALGSSSGIDGFAAGELGSNLTS